MQSKIFCFAFLYALFISNIWAQEPVLRLHLMGGFALGDITGYQRWAPTYNLPLNTPYYFSGGAELKLYMDKWSIGYGGDGTFGNGSARNTFRGAYFRGGRLITIAENLYFEPSLAIGLSRNKIRFHGNTPEDFKYTGYYTKNAFLRQTALLFNPQLEFFAQKGNLVVGLQVGYNWSCLQGNWRYGEMEVQLDSRYRPSWWFNGGIVHLPKMPADHLYARLMVGLMILDKP